ncbi:MAG: hypothetical protein ACFE88_15955 [Candidatus Hermodarchaeota archaeon]
MELKITKSEDVLVFYGLTPELTKFKNAYNSISKYMEKKQSNDPSDRFNLILFLQDGPNYLDHFTFDTNHVLSLLKSVEKDISIANIAGGVFVATTFVIEVYKRISEKIFRLLILIDDGAYAIPTHYLPALEELINKVKDMPFFIDIVHIGHPEYEARKNITQLVNLCNGEYHEIIDIDQLDYRLTELSYKKKITKPAFGKQTIPIIPKENQPFYVNLADNPENVNEISTCSICFQQGNEGIIRCPSCHTIAHKVCWAQWAETSNIGIPHVYRCHNCFNILKLDKFYIMDVQTGKIPTIAELKKMKKKDVTDYLRKIEAQSKPQVVHTEDPFAADIRAMIKAKREETKDSKKKKKKKKKK